jgi:hypothetical protein
MDYEIIKILVAIIALLGGMWKIAKDLRDDVSKTTSLLFKRFDDHKEATDKKFMFQTEINDTKYAPNNICILVRSANEKIFSDINRKLDLLLEERRKHE